MENISSSDKQSSTSVSSRWNPTREQIAILESLYRQGIRTPSAQQIQQITCRLRMHGNIEGKNVFYWFQNHKARQRQKEKEQNFLYLNQLPPHFAGPPTNIVSASYNVPQNGLQPSLFLPEMHVMSSNTDYSQAKGNTDIEPHEVETLQLFPLRPDVSATDIHEDNNNFNNGKKVRDMRMSSPESIGNIFHFFPQHPCQ
ncbi:hypothetical protein KI387_043759 [Taxus chinensis]|uniref:Homeobox domain-containing protein n=1 Tax=Taxus chinensis TaxID=29808 RepID=A0AA38GWJ7_TAXCH|nr:hypothetical protein KI387_043759 [Taxus chinensis]